MTLPILESLVGKVVRINKGGPESKTGKLLAVQSDYVVMETINEQNQKSEEKAKGKSKEKAAEQSGGVALQTLQEMTNATQIVYYRTHHIKSVKEDTTDISGLTLPSDEEETSEYIEAQDFHQMLGGFLNECVRIDRGGPESRCGWLLAVKPDHLVLQTKEDGVLYYNLEHIKSISSEMLSDNQLQSGLSADMSLTYLDADDFNELFEGMKYYWVKINRGGPESIEGILVDGADDHIVLAVGKEVHRISTFHIRNISLGAQSQQNTNGGNSNSEQNAEQKSSDKQKNSKKKDKKKDGKKKDKKKK
ncbi:hypothetical protein ACFO8Q_00180 [Effusibacillus consociatus]|uniref:Spore coat protein B n=2 Tax=Effusibacillus consociatus TaxID=1117041 RepID=A0ABV9PWH7_9BACL